MMISLFEFMAEKRQHMLFLNMQKLTNLNDLVQLSAASCEERTQEILPAGPFTFKKHKADAVDLQPHFSHCY